MPLNAILLYYDSSYVAAQSGARLAHLLQEELTLPLYRTILWSDSTTVQAWIHSEKCRYKIFVANRITEILDFSSPEDWRYVASSLNPADNITRGKRLLDLIAPTRWATGPTFLDLSPDQWPKVAVNNPDTVSLELPKRTFIGHVVTQTSCIPEDLTAFKSWNTLVDTVAQGLFQIVLPTTCLPDCIRAETLLQQYAQQQSFCEEYKMLQSNKPVPSESRLCSLCI